MSEGRKPGMGKFRGCRERWYHHCSQNLDSQWPPLYLERAMPERAVFIEGTSYPAHFCPMCGDAIECEEPIE